MDGTARAKGRFGGRPNGLPPEDFAKALRVKEKSDAGMPMTQIAKMLKLSRSTDITTTLLTMKIIKSNTKQIFDTKETPFASLPFRTE